MITLIDQSALNNVDQSQQAVLVYKCSDCNQEIRAKARAEAEMHARVCPARPNAQPDVTALAADMVAMRQEMLALRSENAVLRGQHATPAVAPEAPKPKRGRRKKDVAALTE